MSVCRGRDWYRGAAKERPDLVVGGLVRQVADKGHEGREAGEGVLVDDDGEGRVLAAADARRIPPGTVLVGGPVEAEGRRGQDDLLVGPGRGGGAARGDCA